MQRAPPWKRRSASPSPRASRRGLLLAGPEPLFLDRNDITRRRLDEARDRVGGNDGVLLGIGLVVLLDVLEVVEVVHHQPVRLPQRPLGGIGGEIQPLEPRAVAQVETRNQIERRAAARARTQVIPRRRAEQRLAHVFGGDLIAPPIRPVERLEQGAVLFGKHERSLARALALEPFGKVRRRRQGDEGRQARDWRPTPRPPA